MAYFQPYEVVNIPAKKRKRKKKKAVVTLMKICLFFLIFVNLRSVLFLVYGLTSFYFSKCVIAILFQSL